MSCPSGKRGNEFGNAALEGLDSMSAAELLELLERINETMTEDSFDGALVTACLDALDRKSPTPAHASAEESWRSFENKVGLDDTGGTSANRTGRRVRRVFRTGLAAAVIVFCLFSCMIAAQAAGADVFGSIARWTDNLFGFGNAAGGMETAGPAETALEYVEAWRPELDGRFVRGEPVIIEDELSGALCYSLRFDAEDGALVFEALSPGGGGRNSVFEKDEGDVRTIVLDRAVFYVFENCGDAIAAWTANGVEFSLASSFSTEELESIIIEAYGGG